MNWSQELKVGFETGIDMFCHDSTGLLRDITTVLANENVPLLGVNSLRDKNRQTALITLSIEVQDLDTVSKVLTRLRQLNGVTDAKRKQS